MPADAPPPLDQTTRAVLDEIATEQWSVEPYARDEVPMFILSGDLRILQNYNLDIEEMHAVAALPEVVRQLRQAESERTTLAAQTQRLRELLRDIRSFHRTYSGLSAAWHWDEIEERIDAALGAAGETQP